MKIKRLRKTKIGAGWLEEFNAQLSELPFSEELKKNIVSEANISRNRRGGAASGYYYQVANHVVDCFNEGRKPRFENVQWNEQFKVEWAVKLKAGLPESSFPSHNPCLS